MNTQVHKTTGASPYELLLGQKPRSVIFQQRQPHLEEDLTDDGVHFNTETSTLQLRDKQRKAPPVLGKRTVTKAYIQAVNPANE